jgi:hypothetical protein
MSDTPSRIDSFTEGRVPSMSWVDHAGTIQSCSVETLQQSVRELKAELTDTKADNERLREALSLIASCQSHHSGDVVDIAQAALKEPK